MKTIYYEPAGRVQNSEWELINNPPEGYQFVLNNKTISDKIVHSSFMFDKVRDKMDTIMPLNLLKSGIDDLYKKVPKGVELLYLYNHITSRKIPWVVNVEWAQVLVGREPAIFGKYKGAIEKALSSEWCKGIFAWDTLALQSIRQAYDTSGFDNKLQVVFPAISAKDIDRTYTNDAPLNILFVGSIDTPEDFYAKGCRETLAAFRALTVEYPYITFTVRANIPDKILNARTRNPRVKFINHVLPKEELNELFRIADIFVLPSHYAQEMVVLEAMSWGLPVVTSRVATMGEWIDNGETGFILNQPKGFEYIINEFMLTSETTHRLDLVKRAKNYSVKDTADELVVVLRKLINDAGLRERIGTSAKLETTTGKLSINHRNKLLKGVFDKA